MRQVNISVVGVAVMPPGACYLTGTSVGPFIDTGYQIDDLADQGRVYLAESTVVDLASALGYAPPVSWQRAQDEMRTLRAALSEAQELVHVLRATNESLVNAGFTPTDLPPARDPEGVLEWVHALGPDMVAERAQKAFVAETLEPHPRAALLKALGPLLPKEATDVGRSDTVPV